MSEYGEEACRKSGGKRSMSRYIDEDDVRAAVTAWDMQDL